MDIIPSEQRHLFVPFLQGTVLANLISKRFERCFECG